MKLNGLWTIGSLSDFLSCVSSMPYKPDLPWIWGAVYNFPISGPSDPLTTGIWVLFISHNISNAFLVVLSTVELPAEVEIPINSHY